MTSFMLRSMGFLVCGALFHCAANAAPVTNQNNGFWLDLYQDDAGIAAQNQTEVDTFDQVVQLIDDQTSGDFTTTPITPSSFSEWKLLTLEGTWSSTSEVSVTLLDPGNGDAVIAGFNALPYDGPIDLSGVDPIIYPQLKVRVALTEVLSRPRISELRVTWTPLSVLAASLQIPASVSSGATAVYRVTYSVSFVNALDTVVWLKLPDHGSTNLVYPTSSHPDAPYPGQSDEPEFVSATQSGQFTGVETNVAGVTVPANSVYWSLGARDAGNAFFVEATLRVKAGTLNGTELNFRGFADAANAEPVQTVIGKTTAVASQVNQVRITSTFFDFGGATYAPYRSTNTLGVGLGTFLGDSVIGRETLYNAVLYEDLTPLTALIEDGGDGLSLEDLEPAGEGAVFDPVFVPPTGGDPRPSIVWTFPAVPPNLVTTLTYRVVIRSKENIDTGTTSFVRSAHLHAETAFQRTTNATVLLGMNETPLFAYALGELFNGVAQISAGNDHPSANLPDGSTYTALHQIQNQGVVELNDILLFNRIPSNALFVSAFLPTNANGITFYSTSTDPAFVATNPPPVDITQLPSALDPVGETNWISYADQPPADPSEVTWVVHYVPALASPFFPSGDPVSIIGHVQLAGNLASPCTAASINNTGYYRILGKTPFAGPPVEPIDLSGSNSDPMNVVPNIPSMNATASFVPTTYSAGGEMLFRLVITNAPGAAAPAMDPRLHLTWGLVSLNGTPTYLNLLSVSNGVIDSSSPGSAFIILTNLNPGVGRSVFARFELPAQGIASSSFSVTGVVSWVAACAPTSLTRTASASLFFNPALQISMLPLPAFSLPGGIIEASAMATSSGGAPATRAWVVMPVPSNTVIEAVLRSAEGAPVYFSASNFPPLNNFAFPVNDEAYITNNFALGIADDNGTPGNPSDDVWTSPFGEATTMIAIKLDDPALGVFPSPSSQTLNLRLRNDEDPGPDQQDSSDGTLISIQGRIIASGLLGANSNIEVTQINPVPDPVYAVFEGIDDSGSELFTGQTNAVTFGPTPVGAPVLRSFTVRNDSAGPIQFHSITVPAAFSEAGTPLGAAPIPAGESRTFQVQYNAATVGTQSGQLRLRFYPEQTSPFQFPVSGTAFIEFPTNLFALGDFVSITHGVNDGPGVTVRPGDVFDYQLLVRANAPIGFEDVLMLNRIPSNTTFVSLAIEEQVINDGRLYYSTATDPAYQNPTNPPPVDIDQPDLNPVDELWWRDYELDPPEDPADVTWVAIHVPVLHSALAVPPVAPTSALARLFVEVTPPDVCSAGILSNRAICVIYGKVPVGESESIPATPGGPVVRTDVELTSRLGEIPTLSLLDGIIFEQTVDNLGFTREIEAVLVISNGSSSLIFSNMVVGIGHDYSSCADVFCSTFPETTYPVRLSTTPDTTGYSDPFWVEILLGELGPGMTTTARARYEISQDLNPGTFRVYYLEAYGNSDCGFLYQATSAFTNSLFDVELATWLVFELGYTNNLIEAAYSDLDGDLYLNWEEFIAGTDPFDDTSYLRITDIQPAFGTNFYEVVYTNDVPPFEVETQKIFEVIGNKVFWPAVSGRVYQLTQEQNIFGTNWIIAPDGIDLDSIAGTVVLTNLPPMPTVLFRLEAQRLGGQDE